jgi:hypothetical protein
MGVGVGVGVMMRMGVSEWLCLWMVCWELDKW